MTNEEAIKILQTVKRVVKYGRIGEAVDMAVAGLEKEIPYRPQIHQWMHTICRCGHELSEHHGDGYYEIVDYPDRCPECGQVLDWGWQIVFMEV